MGLHPDWLRPDWPAPAWVGAVCTTRAGGHSQGPFASMNLGQHVGDDPAHVAANREHLTRALQARPVFMQQVHGTAVVQLQHEADQGLSADGALTQQMGLACTVMVADCLPILIAHDRLPLVAALHAGWRGLAAGVAGSSAGIVEAGLDALADAAGCSLHDLSPGLMAWLGPCIGPSAFEVGAEVRTAFIAADAPSDRCFVPLAQGKYRADLPSLARRRLERAGLSRFYGNDGSDRWCTVANSAFFSHRGSLLRHGISGGRMAACIWLV
ncbi:MAG: peptidoglycan editing factor PgeF [Betaproteobacteria bacterium]